MKKAEHVGVYLKLNKEGDKDIIKRLDDSGSKQGYIKDLIRTDIALDCLRNGIDNGIVNVKKG